MCGEPAKPALHHHLKMYEIGPRRTGTLRVAPIIEWVLARVCSMRPVAVGISEALRTGGAREAASPTVYIALIRIELAISAMRRLRPTVAVDFAAFTLRSIRHLRACQRATAPAFAVRVELAGLALFSGTRRWLSGIFVDALRFAIISRVHRQLAALAFGDCLRV